MRLAKLWRRCQYLWWRWTCRRLTLDDFCKRITGVPRERWRFVIRRDPCSYCGARARNMTVEHVWPGWRNRPEGRMTHTVGACWTCNHERGDMPLLQYLLWRQTQTPKPLSRNQLRAAKRIEDRHRRTRVRRPVQPTLRASIGDRIKWKNVGG